MVFKPETVPINGDKLWDRQVGSGSGAFSLSSNVNWNGYDIRCTEAGQPSIDGVPQCSNVYIPDAVYKPFMFTPGNYEGQSQLYTPPTLTIAPYAGIRYWLDWEGSVASVGTYRYNYVYEPMIGAPVPTTPDQIIVTDDNTFQDTPPANTTVYESKCNVGEILVGIQPYGNNEAQGVQALCVPALNTKAVPVARGVLPIAAEALTTEQNATIYGARCSDGSFPVNMYIYATGSGLASDGFLQCATSAQAQGFSDYAEHFPVLSTDPACTGGTTNTNDPNFVTAENNCLSKAKRVCADDSVTFSGKKAYCACIDATPLDDTVPVRCASIGDCVKITDVSRGLDTPGTWSTYEYVDRKNCPPITITECDFLSNLSVNELRLIGDTVTFDCGQKTCPECKGNNNGGGGTCRSLKPPYVCQPPNKDGTCQKGFVSCESSVTTHPGTGNQPWYFIFIDPAPFFVGGIKIGSTGTVTIVGVVVAFVLFILIMFGVVAGSLRMHRYRKA